MRLIHRLICLAACFSPGLAIAADNVPSLLIPAYFYPESDSADWARMTAAAKKVSVTAIINPNSGPGTAYDPVYAKAIAGFKAAGGTVLGYVSTDWGQRNLLSVKADIDKYQSWYPIDGLFFDETTTNSANLGYYSLVTNYSHLKNPSLSLMANPGTPPENEGYFKLFNSVVIYEDPASNLANYTAPGYQTKYSADHFGMLVIDGNAATMQTQVAYAASHNLGYIYVNDRPVSANEWGALPAYFEAEVAAIQAITAVPEPEQFSLLLVGLAVVAGVARRKTPSTQGIPAAV